MREIIVKTGKKQCCHILKTHMCYPEMDNIENVHSKKNTLHYLILKQYNGVSIKCNQNMYVFRYGIVLLCI